jgi:hypothetical protein
MIINDEYTPLVNDIITWTGGRTQSRRSDSLPARMLKILASRAIGLDAPRHVEEMTLARHLLRHGYFPV